MREWVNFVRELEGVRTLWFSRCSPPVVLQLNTIYNFRGRARVSSFLAPYVCEACHGDEYKLLDVAEHFPDRRAHVAGVPLRSLRRRHGVRRAARALPVVPVGGGAERPLERRRRGRVTHDPLNDALADLKRVLEGAVDAAVILDQDHRVLYRNSAYDAYTGRRPREVGAAAAAGTPCHELFNLEICAQNCIMRRAVAGAASRCACTRSTPSAATAKT